MARKQRPLTNEELAAKFTHYGRNMAAFGVMEAVQVAAEFEAGLEKALAAIETADTFEQAAELTNAAARQMTLAEGMRVMLAGTVKRFTFTGFGLNPDDADPDGSRSRAIVALMIAHAAANPSAWADLDDDTDGDDDTDEDE